MLDRQAFLTILIITCNTLYCCQDLVAVFDENPIEESILHKGIRTEKVNNQEPLDLSLVNVRDSFGRLPIHVAAMTGNHVALLGLLKAQSPIDAQDQHGTTPLHKACMHGHKKCVPLLLEYKADVNIADHEGKTALHLACIFRRHTIGTMLIKAHASTHCLDKAGHAAIYEAICANDLKMVTMLVESGAYPYERSSMLRFWHHPLWIAADNDMYNYLIESGCAIHLLWQAILLNDIEKLETALKLKPNVNVKNSYGQTPIHFAASFDSIPAILALIFAGACIDVKDNEGETPASLAQKSGNSQAAQLCRAIANGYPVNDTQKLLALLKKISTFIKKDYNDTQRQNNFDAGLNSC